MFKNKAVFIVIGVLVLLVAVILGLKYSGLYNNTNSAKSSPSSNLVIPANTVIIQGNAFSPDTLTVKVGTKVTWTNNESYDHTVASDDGSFDSGNIGQGQSYSFTFTKAGTYSYHCAIHTFMTAKVVVTN